MPSTLAEEVQTLNAYRAVVASATQLCENGAYTGLRLSARDGIDTGAERTDIRTKQDATSNIERRGMPAIACRHNKARFSIHQIGKSVCAGLISAYNSP